MIDERQYFVYILASGVGGTLYVGVTNNLFRRIAEHRDGKGNAFASRYGVTRLVYYEVHDAIHSAIAREKSIKRWRRAWKVDLIEQDNPNWVDRWPGLRP